MSSNFRYWGADKTPIMARGKGAKVWDADGNEYIDYRLGDCRAPGIIAAAVYAGHRLAREMDAPEIKGLSFRRERVTI